MTARATGARPNWSRFERERFAWTLDYLTPTQREYVRVAVDAHDALVMALELCVAHFGALDSDAIREARAILSRIDGEAP